MIWQYSKATLCMYITTSVAETVDAGGFSDHPRYFPSYDEESTLGNSAGDGYFIKMVTFFEVILHDV